MFSPSTDRRPPLTANTAVPSSAETSTPKWNDLPPPSPIRGSPNSPRTGCCRSNGLIGQGWAFPAGTIGTLTGLHRNRQRIRCPRLAAPFEHRVEGGDRVCGREDAALVCVYPPA